jgi:hypothetical protein
MSPYAYDEKVFAEYSEKIKAAIQSKLEAIYAE